MGKHRGSASKSTSDGSKTEKNSHRNKMELLTSQLLDLCGANGADQQTSCSVNSLWTNHLEIRRIIDEIREIQLHTTDNIFADCSSSTRGERLRKMGDWCVNQGLKTDDVSIENDEKSPEHFGLKLRRNVQIGDSLIRVPRRLFLSTENGIQRNGELKNVFRADPLLSGMPNVALTLLTAVERLKGTESFWHFYLNSLPYPCATPLQFLIERDGGSAYVEKLRGSLVFEETLKLYKNIARQYAYFYQMLSTPSSSFSIFSSTILPVDKFVFDLYAWAAMTVMTRINFVPSDESKSERKMIPALIPFFDMANHGDVEACTDFLDDENDSCFAVIYAAKNYRVGDEVLIYYGQRKFWEFFLYNGFIFEKTDGRFPNVVVKLGLSNGDRLLELKSRALQKFGLKTCEQFLITKRNDEENTRDLFRFAIIFSATEEELRAFCDSEIERNFEFSPPTMEKARSFLRTRFALLLKAYASADSNIEDFPTLSASAFIRCEKDVLKNAIEFFS